MQNKPMTEQERNVRLPLLALAGVAIVSLLLSASVAAAHCCHDERALGAAAQSRFHGFDDEEGDGITEDAIEAEPPTVGGSMRNGPTDDWSVGGLGSMQGNGLGNYGAGSIGQTGPGGLGAMQGTGIGAGPTIRGR